MDASEESGVSFNINYEQQSFRLLELPPTLLNLITSNDPPILYLKPAFPDTASIAISNAILCTPDQTFEVHQIQSSNTIHILRPSAEIDPSGDDYITDNGISVIGQCKAILEVVPTISSAIPYLKHHLPVLHGSQIDIEPQVRTTSINSVYNETLLREAPCSAREFEEACNELCVFEMDYQKWLPSASTLLGLWKAFTSAATLKGVNISKPFLVRDISSLVEEDGFSHTLLQAVMRRLAPREERGSNSLGAIDPHKCVPWIGAVLLEAKHRFTGSSVSDFLTEWQELLPDIWRETMSVEMLKDKVIVGDVIAYPQAIEKSVQPNDHSSISNTSKVSSKWHEKFKYAR